MSGQGSIVDLCQVCQGHPERFGGCFNCRPSWRTPYHPGPGYVLRGQCAHEFAPGTVVIDVYYGWQMVVAPPKRRGGPICLRRLNDGFENEEHQCDRRYVTPERMADPATWVRPPLPAPDDGARRPEYAPRCDVRQGVLL